MKNIVRTLSLFILFSMILSLTALASTEQKIYDFAELLVATELEELEYLADMYSDQTQVDIIILTTNGTDGRPVEQYMGDFYDEMGLGYNKPHGDTVILTIDMQGRDVYVAGFYKGETYVDDYRAEIIREEITPYLSDGNFFEAFWDFIELTKYYLELEPEIPSNPTPAPNWNNDVIYEREYYAEEGNIFFELWFQLLASGVVGALVVGIMAYHSSGRKTTNARTYLDDNNSALIAKNDTFLRKTVTKVKKPTSNNNRGGGGGFGGGGFTGGGHSHSGSKGKF